MEKRSGMPDEDRRKSVTEKVYEDFEPAPIPIAPDGGIAPGYAVPMPEAPAPTEDTWICLAGPCRHFWQIAERADPLSGSWGDYGQKPMMQLSQSCTVQPGMETELSYNSPILTCNRWDPFTATEVAERERRQKLYQIRRAAERANEDVVQIEVVDDGETQDEGAEGADSEVTKS